MMPRLHAKEGRSGMAATTPPPTPLWTSGARDYLSPSKTSGGGHA